jgi:hypothetical protein
MANDQFLGHILGSISQKTQAQKAAERNLTNAIVGIIVCMLIIYIGSNFEAPFRSRFTTGLYYASFLGIPFCLIIIISSLTRSAKANKERTKLVNGNAEIITDFMKNSKFGYLENVSLAKQVAPLGIDMHGHWAYLDQVKAAKQQKISIRKLDKSIEKEQQTKPSLEEWKAANPEKGIHEYFQKYGNG